MQNMKDVFGIDKPVIGMLHLDCLLGTPGYKELDYMLERARRDIEAMQEGGIDGILIENWREDSVGQFVAVETAVSMAVVVKELAKDIKVPFGINVLNNDYKVAYALAAMCRASFVQLDVLVDEVESDFSYGENAKRTPFRIKVDQNAVKNYAKLVGMESLPLLCFVQPKHYKMLEVDKPIQKSVEEAERFGVVGVLITKMTGTVPTLELVSSAKEAAKNIAVGVGSGFSAENAKQLLAVADFAVVGSSIKVGGDVNNEVDVHRVKQLMDTVGGCRMAV